MSETIPNFLDNAVADYMYSIPVGSIQPLSNYPVEIQNWVFSTDPGILTVMSNPGYEEDGKMLWCMLGWGNGYDLAFTGKFFTQYRTLPHLALAGKN